MEKKRPGRHSKFNEALRETILRLYKAGKTDKQVADIIGVSRRTLINWRGKNDSFLHSVKEAKQIADELVEASLFSRATGYSHPEEKIFQYEGQIITHKTVKQYAPDTTAAIFWLKNRQPKRWRDRQEIDLTSQTKGLSDEALDKKIAALQKKLKLTEEKK